VHKCKRKDGEKERNKGNLAIWRQSAEVKKFSSEFENT